MPKNVSNKSFLSSSSSVFLRVVMRREQVLKICLNHALTNEITYKPKDEKSWLFVANDFSDGELSLEQLCLRFQNKDIALQFKEAVDGSLAGKSDYIPKSVTTTESGDNDNDVVFVSETQPSADDRKKARELMLHENFYNYKIKEPCKGCRGCNEDNEVKPVPSTEAIKAILSAPPVTSSPVVPAVTTTTPEKSTVLTFQTPTGSIYGTPGGMDKTFDTSIFRTPLGSTGANTESLTPAFNDNGSAGTDASVNKENLFAEKAFSYKFGEQKSLFANPKNTQGSLFGGGDVSSAASNKTPLIAAPKLNAINSSGTIVSPDPKSVFSSAVASMPGFSTVNTSTKPSIFGNADCNAEVKSMYNFTLKEDSSTEAKSLFGAKQNDDSNTEVVSLFGGNDHKPLSIFSGASQGSLFGPGSLGNQSKPTSSFSFGQSLTNQSEPTKSIFFGNTTNTSFWNTNSNIEPTKPMSIFTVTSDNIDIEKKSNEKESDAKGPILKVEDSLSFADLSSSGAGFESE